MIKNMATQNMHCFNHVRGDLMAKVDEAFRQAMDSMGAMEWFAQDHSKEAVVPRFQVPFIPSVFGEEVGRDEPPRPRASKARTLSPPPRD